jgi:spore coat polysaccharide biosynthesis protein SpsF (cytidylyltransferase family)
MGSSRLKGKVLLPLANKPAIQHVIERSCQIPNITDVVVATSHSPADDPLVTFCKYIGLSVFRGSEEDVLDRYYHAALFHKSDVIVRITGDCPLLDPLESGKVVKKFLDIGVDYVSNINPPMLPDGLDTEVFSIKALQKAWKNAKKKSEREHVTLHIYSNPDMFSLASVKYEIDRSDYRLTLDEEADYALLKEIFSILDERQQFGYLEQVLSIIEANPKLKALNSHIKRNEGLAISIARDG